MPSKGFFTKFVPIKPDPPVIKIFKLINNHNNFFNIFNLSFHRFYQTNYLVFEINFFSNAASSIHPIIAPDCLSNSSTYQALLAMIKCLHQPNGSVLNNV